uniref:FLZ-type domain-containing protein n=1 Tax=Ananas comosus var. bracteatus TaxID=296719 RepID=A0A6V7NF86_ANACO|nr:unnamed protein product [Ananas comosus var. bracteatus]
MGDLLESWGVTFGIRANYQPKVLRSARALPKKPTDHKQAHHDQKLFSLLPFLLPPPLFPLCPHTPFLEHCFLCNKKLSHGQDIYMYRGDRAFCSVECRCRQIYMDEESVRREKKCSAFAATDTTTVAAASRRRGRVGGKGGALDGGFAF